LARKTTGFDIVRRMGLALPGVEEGTTWGAPCLRVNGRMFTCIPTHRSAEPDSLAVRIDFRERDELIAAEPETYYLKDHYVSYPCVLVRLSRIHPDALRDLLAASWQFVASKTTRRGRATQSRAASAARSGRRPGPLRST
jgi:hypothetical protein